MPDCPMKLRASRFPNRKIDVQSCPDEPFWQPQRTRAAPAFQNRVPHQRAGVRVRKAGRRWPARQDRRVQAAGCRRRVAGQAVAGGLRGRARRGETYPGHASLRRADGRRHGAAPGQDRRDAHRRRQDPGRHVAGLPQCAGRQGRARGHRQRLPGTARLRADGQVVQLPRPDRGRGVSGHGSRRQVRRLPRRHHLRHQQRIRLRLPARQHGAEQGTALSARPALRDRRRGRLDPHR